MNLKEQAGPLPVGAWIAVVAGGLGVGYLARRKTASGATVAAAPIDSAPISGFRPTIDTTPSSSVPSTDNYSTNDSWGRAAISALIGRGYDPAVATNAINSFLYPSGDTSLTQQEGAGIAEAIKAIGSPPSLPPTYIPTVPSTTTPTATTGGIRSQPDYWDPIKGWISGGSEADASTFNATGSPYLLTRSGWESWWKDPKTGNVMASASAPGAGWINLSQGL